MTTPPPHELEFEFAREFGIKPWEVEDCPEDVWEDWLIERQERGKLQREEEARRKREQAKLRK